MTITRNLDHTGQTGTEHATDTDDTANKIFSMNLGRLTSVAGTNAITGNASISTGLTAIGDDAECTFVAAGTNTAAVTLNVQSLGAIAVRNSAGIALTAGDIISGSMYRLNYDSTEAFWRVTSFLPVIAGAITKTNYIHVVQFSISDTFTAPYKCNIRMVAIGGGGGAGSHKSGSNARATGGGAGGCAGREFSAESGETFTITVGAGGVGGVDGIGTSGGNSSAVSLSGPSAVSISGGLGGGGVDSTTGTILGGVGGAASGGDDNFAGGSGGDVSFDGSASGGGGVGLVAAGVDSTTPAINTISNGGKVPTLSAANDTLFNIFNATYDGGNADRAGDLAANGISGTFGGGGGAAITTGVGNAIGGNGGQGVVLIQYTGEIS